MLDYSFCFSLCLFLPCNRLIWPALGQICLKLFGLAPGVLRSCRHSLFWPFLWAELPCHTRGVKAQYA